MGTRETLSDLLRESGALTSLTPEKRRRIEQETTRLELIDRLSTQQNSHVFAILQKEADNTITYSEINRAAATHLSAATGTHYEPEDLIGSNSHELGLPQFSDQLHPFYAQAMRTGTPQDTVATLNTPAGPRHFHNVITPIDENSVAVHAYDITEQVEATQSHSLFKTLVEHSRDIIALIDIEDHSLIYQSPSIQDILGHDPQDVPDNALHWAAPEELPSIRKAINDVIDNPEKKRSPLDVRARHKDGSYRTLEASSNLIYDGETPRWLVVNARDVTEQRSLEAQLLQSQKMEGIGRLAGGVAHDFNNILTVLQGAAEFLENDNPDNEDIQEIKQGVERAAALTRQLLAFSRKQVLRPEVIDVNGIIAGLQKMLGRIIGEDIQLDTELQYQPWKVEADPGQLEQVIVNLATNARDAMPRGGSLRIETRNQYVHGHDHLPEGEYVELRVRDTGSGIEEEHLAHIFEPFYTTKPEGRGTGLGLSTVYGIIKQSGGEIDVQSTPEAGTTFHIYFPHVNKENHRDEEAAHTRTYRGDGIVLVVEDEPALLKLADRALTSVGYRVIRARNGREGKEAFDDTKNYLSAVVSDIVMPELDGTRLAQQIHAERPDLPIILTTGYSQDFLPQIAEGLKDDAFQPLEKPYSPKQLQQLVHQAITGS